LCIKEAFLGLTMGFIVFLSAEQSRSARAWLNWSQSYLAEVSKVSKRAIADFERGETVPHDRTLRDIQVSFERTGIEFLFEGARGVGIRRRL
jgi:transcriptional regulator with XRE-family HTH domain